MTTEPAGNNGGYGTLTFNANVNPNGGNTYVYFQWGTTVGLGYTTPSVNIGSGTTTVSVPPVNVSIANTAVGYYFRAVASNPSGLINGSTLYIYGGAPE